MRELEKWIALSRQYVRMWLGQLHPEDTDKSAEELTGDWWDKNPEIFSDISGESIYDCISDTDIRLENIHRRCQGKKNLHWLRYWGAAAVVLVAIGSVIFRYYNNQPEVLVQSLAGNNNKVSLILENGEQIVLNAPAGESRMQLGSAVADIKAKTLEYRASAPETALSMNTLVIPPAAFYHLILSDGTKIWMNADSKITYPTVFSDTLRQVELTGEAYFEVTRNEGAPFIVKTGQMDIRVLGTEFGINTFRDEGYTFAALVNGKIEVSAPGNKKQQMYPGEVAKVDERGGLTIEKTDLKPFIYWKDNMFCFRHTSLSEILKQISRYYDVEVVYDKDGKEEFYTGNISREKSLQSILEVIEMTIPVKFEIEGRTVVVRRRE